ncbi:MAG: sulfite exporter TauE/SafE family protein [Thiotrichales bacterium]
MHDLAGLAAWLEHLILLLVALVANAFSSFSGGGAGLIQLPVLIFLGLPFALALATHKVATVALGLGASLRHWREGSLEPRVMGLMLVAGLPGVVLGALAIVSVPDRAAKIALGALTLGLGVYSIFKPQLGQIHAPRHRDRAGMLKGGLGLMLIGILNGSLTSGTGLFATLWLVRWFGMDYLRAVAHTLVIVGLFWNGTGAVTLGMISEIHWPWLPALLLGSLLGGYLGAHLAIKKGNKLIKRAFEAVTILIGLRLLFA